jgi:hypothetical protein
MMLHQLEKVLIRYKARRLRARNAGKGNAYSYLEAALILVVLFLIAVMFYLLINPPKYG